MSHVTRPKQLYWIGERGADGRPLEWFGGMPGEYEPIPARDLSPEETAALTEAQLECIDSPAGKRLYRRTEPESHPTPVHSSSTNTDAKSADG